jgi:hypothetical protein
MFPRVVRVPIHVSFLPPMQTSFMRLTLVLALSVSLPAALAAQGGSGPTLEPGDTVRLLAPTLQTRPIVGEVLLYQGDSLTVRRGNTAIDLAIPLVAVERLEKWEGTDRRRSVRRWARAGLFLGAAVGLVSGPLLASAGSKPGDAEVDVPGRTALAGLGGAVLGVSLGAAGGSLFAGERFRWPPPPPSPTGMAAADTLPRP